MAVRSANLSIGKESRFQALVAEAPNANIELLLNFMPRSDVMRALADANRDPADGKGGPIMHWRKFAKWGKSQASVRCDHGCPDLQPPGHAVSKLFDSLWGDGKQTVSCIGYMMILSTHPDVWGNETNRKMALDIMGTIVTNAILEREYTMSLAVLLAKLIAILVGYDEEAEADVFLSEYASVSRKACEGLGGEKTDKLDYFWLAMTRSTEDFITIGDGGKREIIRYFKKRITCSCLDKKNAHAKKAQPNRMSVCSHCGQSKERKLLKVCTRCKLAFYCSRECQVAHRTEHKPICIAR